MVHPADFDPFAPAVVADPYPWYAALHEGERVLYLERRDIWVLSRHADVRTALRDHTRLSSADGVTEVRAPLPMMLTMDPPDHERLRRIAGREFAPRDIDRFRPAIERFVAEGLDAMTEAGTADLVEHVASPVPIRLMASILGVPEADLPELRRLSDDLVQGFAVDPGDVERYDFTQIGRAIADIHAYFAVLIADRRRTARDDLITKLIRPTADGTLSENELSWFCLLLLVAGIETTTNLIGNMAIALAGHPDEWRRVRANRDLVGPAVNEALRFDAPIQGFFRTVTDTYRVGDTEIPPGARVLLAFGAANRDPSHYADPDTFDVTRDPTDHLAFGAGIHRCLGAGLAELEGRVVLEQLLDRTESFEVAGPVERTANPSLRGARRLPLRMGAPVRSPAGSGA